MWDQDNFKDDDDDNKNKLIFIIFFIGIALLIGLLGYKFLFAGKSKGKTEVPNQQVETYDYIVNFDTDGGRPCIPGQRVSHGNTAVLMIEPTKEGYFFDGWFPDINMPITTDFTFVARWVEDLTEKGDGFKVYFDTLDSDVVVDMQLVEKGEKAKRPTDPKRSGFVFKDWSPKVEETPIFEETVFTAIWEESGTTKPTTPNKTYYKVSFDTKGGSPKPADQSVVSGSYASVPSMLIKREGYVFGGWSPAIKSTVIKGKTTFSAIWNKIPAPTTPTTKPTTTVPTTTQKTYVVSFNANGGTGAPPSQTKVHDVSLTLTSSKPTRSGYSFVSWNTKADGTGVDYFAGSVYSTNAGLSLYAKWVQAYTVSYNANGGTGAPAAQTKIHGTSLTLTSSKPTRTDFSFVSWNTKADGTGVDYFAGSTYTANANLVLYAKWYDNSPAQYAVTYHQNGYYWASFPSNQVKIHGQNLQLRAIVPEASQGESYEFLSWNTKADGTGTDYFPGSWYTQNANITFYAKIKK